MKICWDNLEKLKYRQDIGAWQDKWKHFYSYKENCKKCQNSFLSRNNNKYCCLICSSDSKIGNKNPAKRIEVRKKISKSKMGQKLGIKRPNHSKWMIENCPMKKPEISQKFIGENNPNWKGGISCEPYCDVWLDKDFKEAIKERDGYQCLNPTCNKTSNRLSSHHINYIKKDCRPENLITLCVSCNSKANKDRKWHKSWYKAVIYRRYKIETK